MRQSYFSTFTTTAAPELAAEPAIIQPVTSKARTLRNEKPGRKATSDNVPTAWHPSGLALFRRADGQLVYLQCCIDGCERIGFKTVMSLRMHISRQGAHDVSSDTKELCSSNAGAIELCGQLVATPSPGDSSAMASAFLESDTRNISEPAQSERTRTQTLDNNSMASEGESLDEAGCYSLRTWQIRHGPWYRQLSQAEQFLATRRRAKRYKRRCQRKDAREAHGTENDIQDVEESPTSSMKIEKEQF